MHVHGNLCTYITFHATFLRIGLGIPNHAIPTIKMNMFFKSFFNVTLFFVLYFSSSNVAIVFLTRGTGRKFFFCFFFPAVGRKFDVAIERYWTFTVRDGGAREKRGERNHRSLLLEEGILFASERKFISHAVGHGVAPGRVSSRRLLASFGTRCPAAQTWGWDASLVGLGGRPGPTLGHAS